MFLPEFDILWNNKIETDTFFKNTRPKSPRRFWKLLKIGPIRGKKGKYSETRVENRFYNLYK